MSDALDLPEPAVLSSRQDAKHVRCPIRVRYAETDGGGVVYYANYLVWFEAARSHYCRERGISYGEMVQAGYHLPVVEAHCAYHRPAFFDDLLEVEVRLEEIRSRSARFAYRVWRGNEQLASGWTQHISVSLEGKPRAMPREWLSLLAAD
jgi:acyl-CoA thioester hydrolase